MLIENTPESPVETESEIIVPWSVPEIIFSLGVIFLLSIGMIWIIYRWPDAINIVLVSFELVYLIPVGIILLVKRAHPETVGFRKFTMKNLAIGCGLLFGAYAIIILNNLLLLAFNIAPQGEYLSELFDTGQSFGLLAFVGIVIAPLAEEVFFRGFLFGGLSKKYGWKIAALLSAGLFAIAHMQLIVLIPTFILGFVLAYLYHRSKSIWPGIILHLTVNSFSFAIISLASFFEGLI